MRTDDTTKANPKGFARLSGRRIYATTSVWLLLVMGLLLTAGAAWEAQRVIGERDKEAFEEFSEDIKTRVAGRLKAYGQLLTSASALFAASEEVSRSEWQVFFHRQKVLGSYPGIQAFGFSRLVSDRRLHELVGAIRKEGFKDFTVSPPGTRPLYNPVIYVEPFSGRNLRAFGFDAFSDPIRRGFMERSRDNDDLVMTGKVRLVQEGETEAQAGAIIYFPVFASGKPFGTIEDRRRYCMGFVYSALRMNDFVSAVLEEVPATRSREIRLRIFDGNSAAPDALMFDNAPDLPSRTGIFTLSIPVSSFGREWLFVFEAPPIEGVLSTEAALILLAGSLISLLLAAWLSSMINTGVKARRLADALTAELRASEEKRRLSEAALQRIERLESLATLAGGIAHDFNNMLTGLFGWLELIEEECRDQPIVVGYLGKVGLAFNRARDLTRQLLVFAKGGSPIKSVVDVNQILREAAEFALAGSPVAVDYELASDLWPISADANQLKQVFDNLLINAHQAMPQGGKVRLCSANVTAAVSAPAYLSPRPYVCISCADQGSGIPPEHLPHIFDPFFTTKQKGSGLGLSTSHTVISRHEGFIDVSSTLGVGTTFTIYLPASPGADHEVRANDLPVALTYRRILFMDDEAPLRQLVTQFAKKAGCEAVTAGDGQAAMKCYDQSLMGGDPFDLIILDLTVPGGMGGLETLKKLREAGCRVPVIVSSGYSNDPVLADPEKYGFEGSLPKPFNLKAFKQALATRKSPSNG